MLTEKELKQIKDYLALYGKKDSQLSNVGEYTPSSEDYLAIVKNGNNVTVTIEQLENTFLKTFLNDPAFEETWQGAIDTPKLADKAITTEKLADLAVITQKILDSAVTTAKIAPQAVTTDKIRDGAVTEGKIANSEVTEDKLATGAVTSSKIYEGAVTEDKIALGAITNSKIASGTISGAKFVDNSISGSKIQDNSVPGSKIKDGTIENVDIKDNSLSGAKLIDNSISGTKIATNAIESRHLLDNSIPASKILDGTIESIDISDGTISGSKIKDNTIESAKIHDGAITIDKIRNGAVTEDKLHDNAVTTDKILDNSVTTAKILNGAVTEDKIHDDAVTADKILNGSVTENKIYDGAVTANKIYDGAVTAAKIANFTITSTNIANEAITEDKLANGAVTTAKLAEGLISEIQNITDAVPTTGSVKPVQSGGVKTAIDNVAFSTNEKVNTVGIDDEPTVGSNNLVKSKGVVNIVSELKRNILPVEPFTLNGSGMTAATKEFVLIPGHTYTIKIDTTTFKYSQINNGYNIFSLGYYIDNNGTSVFVTIKGTDPVVDHTFVAESADYYKVLIRANEGTSVSLEMVNNSATDVDYEPTEQSNKLVISNGILEKINEVSLVASFKLKGRGVPNSSVVSDAKFKLNVGKSYRFFIPDGLEKTIGGFVTLTVQRMLNGVASVVYTTNNNNYVPIPPFVDIIAEDADYYLIRYRGDVGDDITVNIIENTVKTLDKVNETSLLGSEKFIRYFYNANRKRYYIVLPKPICAGANISLEVPSESSIEYAINTYKSFSDLLNSPAVDAVESSGIGNSVLNTKSDDSRYVLFYFRKESGNLTETDVNTINQLSVTIVSDNELLVDEDEKKVVVNSDNVIYDDTTVKDTLDFVTNVNDVFIKELPEFIGNNNTGVFNYFKLLKNKKYRIYLSKTSWNVSHVSSAIFSIQKKVNDTWTAIYVVQTRGQVNDYYDIDTDDGIEDYVIGFRGDVGETLKVKIELRYSAEFDDSTTGFKDTYDSIKNIKTYIDSENEVKLSKLPAVTLGTSFVVRRRYTTKVFREPIKVSVDPTTVPSNISFAFQSNYTLADAQSTSVAGVQGYDWNVNNCIFSDNEALYITIGFKRNVSPYTFTDEEIAQLNNIKLIINNYPFQLDEIKTDIVTLNNEELTLRYLRNLTRPNYSTDGHYTPDRTQFLLLHCSDIHADQVNMTRIMDYYNHYSAFIDDAVCTGDLIKNTFSQSYNFWHNSGADNVLITTGNHEYYDSSDPQYYVNVTPLQVYNKFFAPYKDNWGTVVFPNNASTEGYNYYYKDYSSKKIRLIALDNMANMAPTVDGRDRTGIQATWLETVLADAKTQGLHVICAIHIGSTIETVYNNSFSSLANVLNIDGTGPNADAYAEFYSLRDKVEAFISNGGIFIGWIAGHRHVDCNGILTSYTQPMFNVATASGATSTAWDIIPKGDDCDRTADSKQQDCFNIYSIDTVKKILRIYKVGSDIDRYGRHKGMLVYDYDNHQVLYYN